ncbi:MAG: 2-oxo acid dehydrogenase subunit E2 [Burkholderiaceae bacterium]|nr:2-oxo acid dehydrogenase subunit E2 [Burkholderiaceae bacterium]
MPEESTTTDAGAHEGEGVRISRLGPMQRIAASHLLRSHLETAPVTLLGEVEVDALLSLRERVNALGASEGRSRASLTAFLIVLVARALRSNPALNANLVDGVVHAYDAVHMGVALSLPDGNLIVPVIRNADRLDVDGVAKALADLGERARTKRLALEDVRGATFTLSNAGAVRSSRWSTPIIALPQCAILGVGAVRRMPVVRDEAIVAASVMPTSLSFDHRAVNGVPAQRFIDTLYELFAAPEALGSPNAHGPPDDQRGSQ